MAQVSQSNNDSDGWSKGNGEFYIASKSITTNRKTELINSQRGVPEFNEDQLSDHGKSKKKYVVYHNDDEVSRSTLNSKNLSSIHVDVRPNYNPVEIPIQHAPPLGFIVSPSVVHSNTLNSQRNRQALRQSSETRVVTKMNIPPLTSPNHRRSHSTDVLRQSKQYQNINLADTLQRTTLRKPSRSISQDNTLNNRKPNRRHHHCCPKYHCAHGHHKPCHHINPYGKKPGLIPFPVPISPGFATCPGCQASFAPVPQYFYPNDTYGAPFMAQPMQVMASPALPSHYSLPHRIMSRNSRGPPPQSTWTPNTVLGYPPLLPQSAVVRTPGQYHCVCCPSGNHQQGQRRVSNFFKFDGEYGPEGPSGRSTMTPGKIINKQMIETKRSNSQMEQMRSDQYSRQMGTPNGMVYPTNFDGSGRKSRQTPTEFIIPIQEEDEVLSTNGVTTTNEMKKSYMSQRLVNNMQGSSWVVDSPLKFHGEVTREDGFPADYIDLIDKGSEFPNGFEYENDDMDDLQTPNHKEVMKLVKKALENSIGSSQVASILKNNMDEHFGPVWQVVAGTEAYGSNIASLNKQLLHFKAFGWAFLLWKTSEVDIE